MLVTICYVVIQKTMSPRKSEEDVMIKFCQKQLFADILQNDGLKNFVNFIRNKLVLYSLFLIKLQA